MSIRASKLNLYIKFYLFRLEGKYAYEGYESTIVKNLDSH